MSFDLAPSLRAARNALILAALDGDGTPASVRFYNGVKPSPGGAVTALQVTVPLDHPSATQTDSTLTFIPAEDGVRIDDKAITWCRFVDGSGDYVMDAAVSGPGGGAPVIVSSTSGSIGSLVRLVSGTLTD